MNSSPSYSWTEKAVLAATVGLFGAGVVSMATSEAAPQQLYVAPTTATSVAARPMGLVTGPSASRLAPLKDQDKIEVEKYFEDTSSDGGFDRWRRIYGEDDNINKVQRDIREGHQITVDKVLWWFESDREPIAGKTVADLGCGTGSLAVPLAKKGAIISASDISGPMADAARERAEKAGVNMDNFHSYKSDLESVTGKYNTVTCIDVLIHYPEDKMKEMVRHLGTLAEERIIISFAPKIWYYELLKKIGSFFPGPSKTTRAYLHSEEKVRAALAENGFKVERSDLTATSFYFSRVLEAKR